MAERKSFVIYLDWRDWLNLLSREQRGDLLSALFDYQCEGQPYDGDDPLVKVTFAFVRTTLDRDNEKYQARCAANARNGQKGGRPRKDAGKAKNPPETDGFVETAEEAGGAAPLPPEPDVFFEEPEEPAAFAEYPPEPTDAAEEYPPTPQTDDRAFCAASRGRSQEPPAYHGSYGAPPPHAAREREDAVERARRNAIRKLQREAFDSYAPPRASPAGGW